MKFIIACFIGMCSQPPNISSEIKDI